MDSFTTSTSLNRKSVMCKRKLICLLRKYREWMSKLVKNKEIPCCTSMWGLEMLLHVFIHVCTCVYLHVTYIGMGLPCGPTHIPVVSVYQCAVWYLPSVVSWREINPLIFPFSLIFPDRLDPWDKNPTGISLSIVRTEVHVLNRCCQYHQGIQTGTLIWGSDIPLPHYGTGPAFEGCRSGSFRPPKPVFQLPKRANWQYSCSQQGYLGHQGAAKKG